MQRKTVTMLVAILMLSAIPLNVSADENDDIPTNAASTGVHDSLVAALAHADLVTTLQGDGPFTVFAPTDDAFAAAGIDLTTFDTDEENATLSDILLYHVYSGAVNAADVTDGLTVTMVNGDEASFTVTNGTVMIGDATVTTADVTSSNGIIHVIDTVLMPPADVAPQGEICYNTVTHMIVPGSDATECESYMYLENYEMNGQNVTGCYNSVTHQVTNVSQAICEGYMWTPAVDIAMTAMATGIHSSLVAALSKADLVTTLQGDGPFTVFAPTDQAFTDAGIDLDSFTTDEEIAALADILLYHVYSGAVNAADVTDGLTVTMVNGDDASFTVTADAVMVGDATVTLADVPASNGVIHVIDTVLMPPADLVNDIPTIASGTGVHTALVAALSKADLVTTLQGDGPFTVFAPTDQAFTDAGIDLDSFTTDEEIAALANILLYHVYSGAVNAADVTDGLTVTMVNGDDASFTVADGTVMVGDATVTAADVIASNGVIHVIDKVLMPPVELVDIPSIAVGTGVHDSLVAALTKANLVTTLQGDGPFTVFAPTDQAFTDAGIDLDSFTTDEEIATLADILLFHVYSGAVNAADVTDGLTVTMVNGDDASFTVADGTVMVGDATVTIADVMASNGVVHVIDKVLMPPADVITCDVTIGISSDGYAFSPASVTIQVNQTVCWQWTDAEMAHNVKEVDGMKSTTYVTDGITSGAPGVNVDFSHTFTEDTVFYYVCEPHMSLDMFGKVTVGDGGIVDPVVSDDKEEENTPGFLGVTMILATLGAVLYSRSNRDEEL
tara:strand:+ start:57156 stop:59516 length:2361 start_codon:yes stop_codon:yes gene_type:complete